MNRFGLFEVYIILLIVYYFAIVIIIIFYDTIIIIVIVINVVIPLVTTVWLGYNLLHCHFNETTINLSSACQFNVWAH